MLSLFCLDAQPLPPRLNCIGDMPDPFCKIAVWDSVKDAIDEEFCKYRSTGMYPYPLSCDHFVHCVRKRASVHRCRPGLHFNPILSVCVWKEHVECKLPSRVISKYRIFSCVYKYPEHIPGWCLKKVQLDFIPKYFRSFVNFLS